MPSAGVITSVAPKRNGFVSVLPGIESWYDLGNKSKTGGATGIEKVRQVADHVNLIQRYIPHIQTNFVLGLDSDQGDAPNFRLPMSIPQTDESRHGNPSRHAHWQREKDRRKSGHDQQASEHNAHQRREARSPRSGSRRHAYHFQRSSPIETLLLQQFHNFSPRRTRLHEMSDKAFGLYH